MEKAISLALFISLVVATDLAHAGRIGLIVNGKAIHLGESEEPLNEENWGAGVQYDFDPRDSKWNAFLTASSLIDSSNDTSYNIGYGLRRSLFNGPYDFRLDAGAVAFLMTRKTFNDNNPFPGILPVISLANSDFAVNSTFVPQLYDGFNPFVFFQFVYYLPE